MPDPPASFEIPQDEKLNERERELLNSLEKLLVLIENLALQQTLNAGAIALLSGFLRNLQDREYGAGSALADELEKMKERAWQLYEDAAYREYYGDEGNEDDDPYYRSDYDDEDDLHGQDEVVETEDELSAARGVREWPGGYDDEDQVEGMGGNPYYRTVEEEIEDEYTDDIAEIEEKANKEGSLSQKQVESLNQLLKEIEDDLRLGDSIAIRLQTRVRELIAKFS